MMLTANLPIAAKTSTGKREYSKEIKKDFRYYGSEMVSLENQFGKVSVETWQKNHVKIAIEIKVKAENESKAQKIFDRIKIQFMDSNDLIGAITLINKEEKSWWDWSNENTDFEINYAVFMPADANLSVNNKYGDVYLASLNGSVKMSLKYGKYQCDGFSDDCQLILKFADGTVNLAKNMTAELKYGSMKLLKAEELKVDSKYSNIEIKNIINVKAETGYDNYKIHEVEEFILNGKYNNITIDKVQVLFANSKYSHFDIGHVDNFVSFDVAYSEVKIDFVNPTFNEIRLQGRYSDFDIDLAESTNYQLDAKSEYAGIIYPQTMKVSYEKEKSSLHEVLGGTGAEGSPIIKARLKYGSLKIRK